MDNIPSLNAGYIILEPKFLAQIDCVLTTFDSIRRKNDTKYTYANFQTSLKSRCVELLEYKKYPVFCDVDSKNKNAQIVTWPEENKIENTKSANISLLVVCLEQSMSGYQASCDTWIHLFSCCANQPQQQQKRRNRRIDRMMIGEPTNFQHTGHIGSGEIEDSKLSLMHDQMQSKGGYDNAISPSVLKVH